MIKLASSLKNISEPFMGSEIVALSRSFKNFDNRAETYENEYGSCIFRFDNRIICSGKIDAGELTEFAYFKGVNEISGLKEDFNKIPDSSSVHSIMAFKVILKGLSPPKLNDNMREVFKILTASDNAFKESVQYDYWLSDVRRKQREGILDVYNLENKSCLFTMQGINSYTLLSEIATLPEERHKGLAKRLILSVCSFEEEKGNTPYLVSKDSNTDLFYERLGFTKQGEKVIIHLD